jgi:hypothetical protein
MACDHIGGPELIELAEAHLLRERVPRDQWEELRFRWSENPAEGMWASIVIEIERREGQWIVTRIDRNREPVAEVGFFALGR